MAMGLYMYCILDAAGHSAIEGTKGINGGPVYAVNYRDIYAAVSDVPYKEVSPSIEDVVAHNRVVEAARDSCVVLPVRFGVIFKGKEGTKKLLRASYSKYKTKLAKLKGKDELGLKLVLEKEAMRKIEHLAMEESEEARKITHDSISAGKGTSYFMKLKLEDVVRNEALNKISQISGGIHEELSKFAEESMVLKTDLDQVVLNSVYLVSRAKSGDFSTKMRELERKYDPLGFNFNPTGPWAPYSFC